MKRIEMHAKTKYSKDYESTIDIEALLWNAHENGEEGIVIVDKDSIFSFPKAEEIYNKLCLDDKTFKDFKVGYGIQLTSIIDEKEAEIVILVKNQIGIKNLYKIFTLYLCKYEKKIPINEVINNKEGLLIGLMLNNDIDLDLSIFDYIEINKDIDVSKIKKNNIVIYSNIPNSALLGDLLGLDVLNIYKNKENTPQARPYMDTEEIKKCCNDENLVIKNTNMIFKKIDRIIINDNKFYTNELDDFEEFKIQVIKSFNKKYKNPSDKLKSRLYHELDLIQELNYGYFFFLALSLINFCNSNNEYYQINGYINNSLVAYILNITDIESYNLSLELFFSEIPNLEIVLSPIFYQEKVTKFMEEKFKDKLIICNYTSKLDRLSFIRIIKKYSLKTKRKLTLREKDYVYNLLNDIPLDTSVNRPIFYLIPNNMDAYDFTPLCICDDYNKNVIYFNDKDLKNNLIRINFVLNENIAFITNLKNKKDIPILYMNDSKVLNLFRAAEGIVDEFKILKRKTSLLNIHGFCNPKLEIRLKNIRSLWTNDLIKIVEKTDNLINEDDIYINLEKISLDEVKIFSTINYLRETLNLVSKSILINKIKLAYIELYYKLYFPKIYYQVLLDNMLYFLIRDEIFSYNMDKIISCYLELFKGETLNLSNYNYAEAELFEVLVEMYERNIEFKLNERKVVVI